MRTPPGGTLGGGGAVVVVVVEVLVAPAGRHTTWPGWITVVATALFAASRAASVTLCSDAMRDHESPDFTV